MKLAERLADESGISYKQLMENAGEVIFEYINTGIGFAEKKTVILAGSGNNGGDGFVIARCMKKSGFEVSVILSAGKVKSALAAENLKKFLELGGEVISGREDPITAKARFDRADIIIDAVFGTGFHGELPGETAAFIRYANSMDAVRIACDIPSGMNSDTGYAAEHTFKADITVALGALKKAHAEESAAAHIGKLELLSIGIPKEAMDTAAINCSEITAENVIKYLPERKKTANKGTYGRLLNVAGSAAMNGAAMMSTLSAMRTGVGITVLAAPMYTAKIAAPQLMEAMTVLLPQNEEGSISSKAIPRILAQAQNATAVLAGCGMTCSSDTANVVNALLQGADARIIIDADGLNSLAEYGIDALKGAKQTTVITPHIGEMARLLKTDIKDVVENAQSYALSFAKNYNTVVVLKSHITYIASPNGAICCNTTGNAGLAKGGSGDVLAGMIASFCAQGMQPEAAAICGVYVHGLCAEMLAESFSLHSMLARDIISQIPAALKSIGR